MEKIMLLVYSLPLPEGAFEVILSGYCAMAVFPFTDFVHSKAGGAKLWSRHIWHAFFLESSPTACGPGSGAVRPCYGDVKMI